VNTLSYNALLLEAEAMYLKKDYAVAKKNLLKILQSRPRDSKANELLGLIYVDENKVKDAIKCLKITAEEEYCSPISLYKLASLYAQNENYLLAIKYLERLFKKEPSSLEIALEIASLYVITEQYRELLRWLKIANKIISTTKIYLIYSTKQY
jgi:tetratricopeptide (TPR) repeat protein